MLDNAQKTMLTTLYQNLDDRALEPIDDYYVPFVEESDDDPIAELNWRISSSVSESVSLLTGQRGSGKSTELRRLKSMLEDGGCEVFLCDMRDYLNLDSPVDITDFLISVMIALSDAVEQRYGENLKQQSYLTRLNKWLQSEVQLDNATLSSGVVDIKASLRTDPAFKTQLQNHLQGHVASLVKQAYGFAAEVVDWVRSYHRDPDRKVVLIVDSVEQLRAGNVEMAQQVYHSANNLFSGHAEELHIPMLHVLYTVPPYVVPLSPGLGAKLGGGLIYNLPSIHVRNRDDSNDDKGVAILESILTKRCVEWEQVFSPEQIKDSAIMTGGDLREFFRLIRVALGKASTARDARLPVPEEVLEQTKNHLRREMLPIAEDDKKWLRKIADSKEVALATTERLPHLARFFDTNLVLNYRNGDDWYDVHPLLRNIIAVGE